MRHHEAERRPTRTALRPAGWFAVPGLLVPLACAVAGCDTAAGQDADAGESDTIEEEHTPDGAGDDTTGDSEASTDHGETAPSLPTCGDGVVDSDEECDDGNRMNGDECDWLCRAGSGGTAEPPVDRTVGSVEASRTPESITGSTAGTTADVPRRVDLVWTGSHYATVWQDYAIDETRALARFLRFDRTGGHMTSEWQYVYPEGTLANLAITWTGSYFGLAWCGSDENLSVMVLDAEGKPVRGPEALASGLSTCAPQIAWDGARFGVTWQSSGRAAVSFAAVGLDLAIGVAPREVYAARPGGTVDGFAAASCGGRNIIVLSDRPADGEPGGLRFGWIVLDSSGVQLRASRILATDVFDSAWPAVACAAWGSAAVAGVGSASDPTVATHLFRFDEEGDLAYAARPLPDGVPDPDALALAAGSGGWFVVDLHMGSGDSRVVRTDDLGGVVSTATLDASLVRWRAVATAFDGEGFGVLGLGETGPVFGRYVLVP